METLTRLKFLLFFYPYGRVRFSSSENQSTVNSHTAAVFETAVPTEISEPLRWYGWRCENAWCLVWSRPPYREKTWSEFTGRLAFIIQTWSGIRDGKCVYCSCRYVSPNCRALPRFVAEQVRNMLLHFLWKDRRPFVRHSIYSQQPLMGGFCYWIMNFYQIYNSFVMLAGKVFK